MRSASIKFLCGLAAAASLGFAPVSYGQAFAAREARINAATGESVARTTVQRSAPWRTRGSARHSSGPPARRVTKLEYAYALRDLLGIDEEAALLISDSLPPEADAGGFDTTAENQGISALHIRSYLEAADAALDAALVLGPRPERREWSLNFREAGILQYYATAEIFGLGVVKLLDDAVVVFADPVCTYFADSERMGFNVEQEGRYRVTVDGYRHQADTLVVMTLFKGKTQGIVASLDELIGSWDLVDNDAITGSVETYLAPGDIVIPCLAEADELPGDPFFVYYEADRFAQNYTGEGVAFRSMRIEGPLIGEWPPETTRNLLPGIEIDEDGELQFETSPAEHLAEIVTDFASRAFSRPVGDREVAALTDLAVAVLADGRPFADAVRVPLRTVLSSPDFLYQVGTPDILEGFAFAKRLAAFLWRGPPDAELLEVAAQGLLDDSHFLNEQVERMLDDPKSTRLVSDFAGQAWRLDEFRLTTPNQFQFPQFNAQLGQAMQAETELFLKALVAENLGAGHLIDADFTFVNRPLAELYGIPGIVGQEMQRVTLPPESTRGGLLTQASVLKITANGTSTSPIPRGNFVLDNLMGTPMPPPPPGVAGLEPDTRGTSTIREQLDAHRDNPTCNACHRVIDPPGFALESFDAIGAFREKYLNQRAVDASGVTPGGREFSGVEEYKQILLDENVDQVARHLLNQLVVFATGAEIENEGRLEVENILDRLRTDGYGVRDMIHEVVASPLFRKTSGLRPRGTQRGGGSNGLFGGRHP